MFMVYIQLYHISLINAETRHVTIHPTHGSVQFTIWCNELFNEEKKHFFYFVENFLIKKGILFSYL